PTRLVVAVNVRSDQIRQCPASIDIAAGDRGGFRMGMVHHRRQDRTRPEPGLRANRLATLAYAPAIIAPSLNTKDRFPLFPSDVIDPEVSGYPVEAHSPGIAQAVSPDFGAGAGAVGEGVIRGDPIASPCIAMFDVDPQDRGEEVADILPRVEGIRRRWLGRV